MHELLLAEHEAGLRRGLGWFLEHRGYAVLEAASAAAALASWTSRRPRPAGCRPSRSEDPPSLLNPLAIKGAGEARPIPVPAPLAEAIEGALPPGGSIREMSLGPARRWALVEAAGARR